MTENATKPIIRFGGFTDAWKQRNAVELCSISTGKSNTQDRILDGEYPFYVRSSIIERSHRYLYDEEAVLTVGDGVGTGKVFHYVNGKYDLHQRVYRMFDFNNGVLAKYFYHYFSNNFYPRVMAMTAKTSVDSVRLEMIAGMRIIFPLEDEQVIIVGILDNIDHLVALRQREYDKTVNIKNAMLEKMFPKAGEDKPEIRFAGFTDAWEQKQLSELADFSKGYGYSKSDLKESGGVPLILYGRLYTKYETVISDVDTFASAKENSVFSRGHEVIVPASGETAEDIARASVVEYDGVILGGDLNIIYPKSVIESAFLAITISNGWQQKELAKRAQGKSVVHIHNSDLQEVMLVYPKLEEQNAISSFFRSLDRLLTLHQRELVKLQNMKRALLEKMFV